MRVDRIFEGGHLVTMDARRPRATAFAVLGGRIVAVGDGDELSRHLSADRVVSLQGRTVVPGFHDAHNHMPSFGMGLADVPLSSPPVERVETSCARSRRAPQSSRRARGSSAAATTRTSSPSAAIRRRPSSTRSRPITWSGSATTRATCAWSVAACWTTSASRARRVPEGGVVERDAAGRPTGLLQEQAQGRSCARWSIRTRTPSWSRPSGAPSRALPARGAHQRAGGGSRRRARGAQPGRAVGVAGGAATGPARRARHADGRRRGAPRPRRTPRDGDGFGLDLGIRTGLGDEWLRIGAVKVFSDGSLIGRTAAMCCGLRGRARQPRLLPDGRRAAARDHRARAPRRLAGRHPRHRRPRRVHGARHLRGGARRASARRPPPPDRALRRVPPGGRARPTALGVIPVPQGRFISEIGDGMLAALGPERAAWCYRQRASSTRA